MDNVRKQVDQLAISLADAIGYLGYVGVMVFRNSVSGDVDFLKLLIWVSVTIAVVSTLITLLLGMHYWRTIPRIDELNDSDTHETAEVV